MKLYAVLVLQKLKDDNKTKIINDVKNLSSFGYFQRSSISEFINFFVETLVEKSNTSYRQIINENKYMFYINSREYTSFILYSVIVCDDEYNQRIAFSLTNKVLYDIYDMYDLKDIYDLNDINHDLKDLNKLFDDYQTPELIDTISKINKDLDDTKIIVHQTIESVLKRGEKLDDLIKKSDKLSTLSKQFYKEAKKTNSCCNIF